MLQKLRSNKNAQLAIGFCIGICFGFLLQRGGVTRYEVIMGQLLLTNWVVVKIIGTAVVTGMIGVYIMLKLGWVSFHRKPGSVGATVIGGLIFGVGFGLLGYCPGTMAGAVGQGNLEALFGGVVGMLLGAAFYAAIYPRVKAKVLNRGSFGDITFPELLKMRPVIVVPIVCVIIIAFFIVLERMGF